MNFVWTCVDEYPIVSKRKKSIIKIRRKEEIEFKDKNNKINKMSAKDDFRMQLCWDLACITTLDALLMFFLY